MIYYTPPVGGKRAGLLRSLGFRCLLNASRLRASFSDAYALDNGAWTAHLRGRRLDIAALLGAVGAVGASADWVVLPDVVGDWSATLELSGRWVSAVSALTPRPLLAVQDGATPAQLPSWCRGIFVGGSTPWKIATIEQWCSLGLYCHVGRVNTFSRLRQCLNAGADSVDGSGPTMFDKAAREVAGWLAQLHAQGRLFDRSTPSLPR